MIVNVNNEDTLRLQPDGSLDDIWTNATVYPSVEDALKTGAMIREFAPGLRQLVARMQAAGWVLLADYGDGDGAEDWVPVTPENVVWTCLQVDEVTVRCVRGSERGWIFVIVGNGEDWLCDHTVNLGEWIDGH